MIICFSGTGNSAAVASRLSVLLDDESLVLLRGEILTGEKPALTLKGERIIWVFPTYSWGVPPVVADFIGRVEIAGADNVPHFMVTTWLEHGRTLVGAYAEYLCVHEGV